MSEQRARSAMCSFLSFKVLRGVSRPMWIAIPFGIEVSYHVRDVTKSYGYEGNEILVVVLDRKDAFQMVLEKDDNARQEILNRSLIYLGGQEYGLSLLDRDPMVVDTQARSKSTKIDATATASSSSSASRLIRAIRIFAISSGKSRGLSAFSTAPRLIVAVKPVATPADAEKLQTQYQHQLDALSNAGQAKLASWIMIRRLSLLQQMVLQMTMKNTAR